MSLMIDSCRLFPVPGGNEPVHGGPLPGTSELPTGAAYNLQELVNNLQEPVITSRNWLITSRNR